MIVKNGKGVLVQQARDNGHNVTYRIILDIVAKNGLTIQHQHTMATTGATYEWTCKGPFIVSPYTPHSPTSLTFDGTIHNFGGKVKVVIEQVSNGYKANVYFYKNSKWVLDYYTTGHGDFVVIHD